MRHVLPHGWIKPLARLGYAARGLIYAFIGALTAFAFAGAVRGADTRSVISDLLGSTPGKVVGWVLLAGLLGYVMWRLIQSLLDTDDHGWSPKGLAVRIGLLASAATYLTLSAYTASKLGLFKRVMGGEDDSTPVADWIAGIIGRDMTVAALAAIFAGVAIAHWAKAARRRYIDHFDCSEAVERFVHPVSITGLVARGTVFAGISFLLAQRLWTGGSVELSTPGLSDVLGWLSQLPGGRWWLALMGAGLILFACYSFMEAVWRRINSEDAKGATEQVS